MGLGLIIGLGWLFGVWKVVKIVGLVVICVWIIGVVVILVIVLMYVELGVMFFELGGMVCYVCYLYGLLVGFISVWVNWIVIVFVILIEVEVLI